MPYKRQLQGSIVWMASYYVPSAMLPGDVRSPNKDKTRIKEPATNAGFPNSEKGAEQLENRRKREIAAGTYSYTAQGEHTAATWVAEWTPLRAARGSKADRRRVELHFCTFQDFGKKSSRISPESLSRLGQARPRLDRGRQDVAEELPERVRRGPHHVPRGGRSREDRGQPLHG